MFFLSGSSFQMNIAMLAASKFMAADSLCELQLLMKQFTLFLIFSLQESHHNCAAAIMISAPEEKHFFKIIAVLVHLDHIFREDCPKQLQNNIPSTDWIIINEI